MVAFPRRLSSIVVSVGGLALFLIFASWLLISYPIGSTVPGHFLGFDHSRKSESSLLSGSKENVILLPHKGHRDSIDERSSTESGGVPALSSDSTRAMEPASGSVSFHVSKVKEIAQPIPSPTLSSNSTQDIEQISGSVSSNVSEAKEIAQPTFPGFLNVSRSVDDAVANDKFSVFSSNSTSGTLPSSFPLPSNSSTVDSGSCDLYHGKWFYDSSGPLYTNNTCPVLTQMQNCQGNGRPDKDYENWRWKPSQCKLPRFNAKEFLELMRGKTLAFIGDSVARNQMESMLCILWQVEVPRNRGNRRMQRWFFRSTSVTIVRIWSSWLVHKTSEAFNFAPDGMAKLHLDVPDEDFMDFLPRFDVVVLSSGHWFAKQSVYIFNNEIVGGQLWWPDKSRSKKINNVKAFGISVETVLSAIVTHPNYTGLTIVRSYSPDHYDGGVWNTGGSCTGKVRPALETAFVANGFTDIMHEKQAMGFNRAIKKSTNQSILRLMDITKAFGYRHDGHPGPYRNPDPNKITKRGPNGKPPPQDCLHWCMPGPVDTWNELVFEIIRREYEGTKNFPA